MEEYSFCSRYLDVLAPVLFCADPDVSAAALQPPHIFLEADQGIWMFWPQYPIMQIQHF